MEIFLISNPRFRRYGKVRTENKWLFAHREAGIQHAFCGLKGENPSL